MTHHHHHHHEHADLQDGIGFALLLGVILNSLFVIAEFGAGVIYHSMGLIADAGHNLGDVCGLLLSGGAFLLARKRHAANYTYGFRKSTVLASLANAVILLLAVGAILIECIQKFLHPAPVGGMAIIITAGIGIVVNGFTVLLFAKKRKHDLNLKGAYIHMLADTLVSVGVVVSGVAIWFSGYSIIDPIVGVIVALVILASAWDLLKDSLRLALDGVPVGIDPAKIQAKMQDVVNVEGIHHLHVWPISTTENALTAHIVLKNIAKLEETKAELHRQLAASGIAHSTLEFENPDFVCPDCHF